MQTSRVTSASRPLQHVPAMRGSGNTASLRSGGTRECTQTRGQRLCCSAPAAAAPSTVPMRCLSAAQHLVPFGATRTGRRETLVSRPAPRRVRAQLGPARAKLSSGQLSGGAKIAVPHAVCASTFTTHAGTRRCLTLHFVAVPAFVCTLFALSPAAGLPRCSLRLLPCTTHFCFLLFSL